MVRKVLVVLVAVAAVWVVGMVSAGEPASSPAKPRRLRRGTPYSITMAEEAMPIEKLPAVVKDHPRLLIRTRPWKGGISLPELRRRARKQPWARWFDWLRRTKPAPRQWRPLRALYYLVTEDESVVPEIVRYVLKSKPQFNCGGGLVDVAIQYDWIYNSPSVSPEVRREMADHIAQVARQCAKIFESGWAFDIWTHRGSPGWASDVLVASLVLDDDHPEAKKLRAWAMGYWKKNYFRAWQHNDGCWLHGGSSYNIALILPKAVACWASATEEDIYEVIRRDYGDWLQKHMYYMMCEVLPDRTRSDAVAWDYNPPGLRMPALNCMMIARAYRNGDCYPYLGWLGRRPTHCAYGGLMKVLFYDPSLERIKPSFPPDAPFARLWGRRGAGYVQIRSRGWMPDSTVIEFKCGDWVWTHTHQNHSNSFWIYHKGRLAVQGGIYDAYGGNHSEHYYSRSISGNTMLIFRPGEFVGRFRATEGLLGEHWLPEPGGQRMPVAMGQTCFTFDEYLRRKRQMNPTGQLFEMGDITAFEHADDFSYTYLCGDATAAYNSPGFLHAWKGRKNLPKIDLFTRSLAWLDNRYLVIFDRVNALDGSYRKAWVCHFQGAPRVSGKLIRAAVPGHIEDYDGDVVEVTWSDGVCKPPDPTDPGRLFIRTFLPKDHYIRRIGGRGYEFWASGRNWPPRSSKGGRQDMGRWRIEVSPSKPAKFDHFLHLLYPCDTRTKRMPPAEMIVAAEGKMIGLAVGPVVAGGPRWIVMFGARGRVAGAVRYRSPPGRCEHLVVDLRPGGRYKVAGPAGGPVKMTASREGVLRFATGAATVVEITPLE